jgi:hypothetical protein
VELFVFLETGGGLGHVTAHRLPPVDALVPRCDDERAKDDHGVREDVGEGGDRTKQLLPASGGAGCGRRQARGSSCSDRFLRDEPGEHERWLEDLAAFDVRLSTCHLAADRKRLLSVIHSSFGGFAGFNHKVQSMLRELSVRHSHGPQPESSY